MAIDTELTILSHDEIRTLYAVPKLIKEDQEVLFSLTEQEKQCLDGIVQIQTKINFILQLGYFKASRYFYKTSFRNARLDVWFIIERYFPKEKFPQKILNINHHYANQKTILELYEYQRSNQDILLELVRQADQIVKYDACPRYIFDQLLDYCEHKKIIRPGYSTLQKIVSNALMKEEQRLLSKISGINQDTKQAIDALLAVDDLFYRLTSLKKEPKNFTTKEMRAELTKLQTINAIYLGGKIVVEQLDISRSNIEYYASLAEYYSIFSLKRMNIEKARLYLLCYVLQKHWKINDHLIAYFIYKARHYLDEAKQHAIVSVYKAKIACSKDTEKAAEILKIIGDDKIADQMIRTSAFKIVPKEEFNQFTDSIAAPKFEDTPYLVEYYRINYHSIKLNLRSIFTKLNFSYEQDTPLKTAIIYFKNLLLTGKKIEDQSIAEVPIKFIPKRLRKYLFKTKDIKENNETQDGEVTKTEYICGRLYETILYLRLQKNIGSELFITDSKVYRSLEDELIPLDVWNRDQNTIIANLPNCLASSSIEEMLQSLEIELEGLYVTVNKRIEQGENKHIKVNAKESNWKLPYQKQDIDINNPFFEQIPTIDLSNVILFVAEQTNFMDNFSHVLSKNTKTSAKLEHIIAYAIAAGTGLGKGKIAESSDVTKAELDMTEHNFIRLETIHNANDTIINKIADLPIFKHFNLAEYGIHGSVDGKKIEVKYQTAKARRSSKYFGGSSMGVVDYGLIANHVPINSIIIGANDHESQYVLDIYLNNTSDIKPTAISSDMHGVNRFNGGLLYLFRCRFMPRFTRLYKTVTDSLIGFKDKTAHEKMLIKPAKTVNKPSIIKQWSYIRRIIASLATKQLSQNLIVKKLSQSKNNSIMNALAEFDNIIMSIYMLKYIDDVNVRKVVQRALNRGEAFNQLISAIMKISGKQILGRTELELSISNECNRFLAICIIYYNCALLSSLLTSLDPKRNKALYELITCLSPVAWDHINMIGKFQFLNNQKTIDINTMIKDLIANLKKKVTAKTKNTKNQ